MSTLARRPLRRPSSPRGGPTAVLKDWCEAPNQVKWRGRWEESVEHKLWDDAHIALMLAQGQTRFNQQRPPAPFVPTHEMPEPTLEWAVSRAFLGMREVLPITHHHR